MVYEVVVQQRPQSADFESCLRELGANIAWADVQKETSTRPLPLRNARSLGGSQSSISLSCWPPASAASAFAGITIIRRRRIVIVIKLIVIIIIMIVIISIVIVIIIIISTIIITVMNITGGAFAGITTTPAFVAFGYLAAR